MYLKRNMKQLIIKSLTAGFLIGLCADINTRVGGPIGALLFSIGLLTICACGLPLFTGRVGSSNKVLELLLMLGLNIVGVLAVKFLFYIDNPIIMGIGCGMLMQIGVTAYKKQQPIITILCVMGFILAGYKHCIATVYTSTEVLNIILIIVGNVIGAKLAYYGGIE